MAVNKAKLASELVGLGSGGGSLEKLTINYYRYDKRKLGKVEALFNPTEIGISRSVSYEPKQVASRLDAGYFSVVQELRAIEPATLSIDLFFDTYESRSDAGSWKRAAASMLSPLNPFQSGDSSPVTHLTSQVEDLAIADTELHRPPLCSLRWGRFDIFQGVLSNLDQRFTMFLSDGTPVRATLSCTFIEYTTESHMRELHSSDVAKTRIVRRDDTLQSIAAEQYGDPTLWRAIAKANGIVNPRAVQPGTVLMIPKLRP